MKDRTIFLATLLLVVSPQIAQAAKAPASGQVIVARKSQNPILIWQASREIYGMIGDGVSQRDIDLRLSHGALQIVAANLSRIGPGQGTLTLQIVYTKMAPDGLNYAAFSLANASVYSTISLPLKNARADKGKWMHLATNAKLPAWIHYRVVGKLPGT